MRRPDVEGGRSPATLLGTAVVVAGLVSGAVVAVVSSGCDDPGTLVARNGVLVLDGGCLPADDLVVPGTPAPNTDPGSVRP